MSHLLRASQNVGTLLSEASQLLHASDSPRLDAELLLGETLGRTRAWLYTYPEFDVPEAQTSQFSQYIQRRVKGEPIAYILGRREFWGLELACDPSTLIPRPDTELLVEVALATVAPQGSEILELGTGTGAITMALRSERQDWRFTATDVSEQALSLAQSNAESLNFIDIHWQLSDWFTQLSPNKRYDLILSNPPYIAPDDPHLNRGDVRYEPKSALVSAEAGLADLQIIARHAPLFLRTGGHLMLEHGFDQASQVKNLLRETGFETICNHKDLSGQPRVTTGRWPHAPTSLD